MISTVLPATAEGWQNFALVASVIAITFAFAFGFINALLGWKVNQTKKAEAREKDEKLALELKEKDSLISQANAIAEKAKSDVAAANEQITIANVKLAEANARIAEAKAEAANANSKSQELEIELQKAVAEANAEKQKLAKMQIEVASAKEQQAKAEIALTELKLRIQPRVITDAQRTSLITFLKTRDKGKVKVTCVMGDAEGLAYARQLTDAFKASGWDVDGVSQSVYSPNNPLGIELRIQNPRRVPIRFKSLYEALTSVGIKPDGVVSAELSPDDLEIVVGIKP